MSTSTRSQERGLKTSTNCICIARSVADLLWRSGRGASEKHVAVCALVECYWSSPCGWWRVNKPVQKGVLLASSHKICFFPFCILLVEIKSLWTLVQKYKAVSSESHGCKLHLDQILTLRTSFLGSMPWGLSPRPSTRVQRLRINSGCFHTHVSHAN